ncbi:tRNA (cytosine(38)-C(5))-methyltransferase [Venturia canescens]|uniref:tRNA (cytosine(38)-C(5))-methyltransferase n=1 Tax=Venturia canescens TaxID=32260 RepID=UPI001C9BF15C|nr:tRNA (cytosine(38)-C(5))-methyltransferase [Venturia canescens]
MMRVLELYSGIGGMHYALKESGIPGLVIAAADINTVANEVYAHNFPSVNNINRNIESLTANEIRSMKIDTILMSPPCQPFTRVGLQKDSTDNRSSSLLHVLTLIPEIDILKQILVENVKGFESSESRNALVDCLEKCGFNYKELILSPCQFGIPNSRHRYYLLAKRKMYKFCFINCGLEYSLSNELKKVLPEDRHLRLVIEDNQADREPSKNCYPLDRIIDENIDAEDYSLPEKLLMKRASVLDIRTADSRGSCCFTKAYGRYVEGTGSVFSPFPQIVVDEKFREFRNRLRENSEDFTRPLTDLKLRFFTPSEISKLMCFPQFFTFPNSTTRKQKYRLLGNSINVHVVSRLIYLLNQE